MKESSKIKRGDFIMLILAGLVGIGLFLWRFFDRKAKPAGERVAIINRNGKEVARIDLDRVKETEYISFEDGIELTIEVEPGKIRFLESKCPDQICVYTGWLSEQGDTAACLPAKTIVTI